MTVFFRRFSRPLFLVSLAGGVRALVAKRSKVRVMSELTEFQKYVSDVLAASGGRREAVSLIRDSMQDALPDPGFLLSCIGCALVGFEQDPDLRPQPPLLVSSDQRFAAHLLYWPPFYSNAPHMHATWGVTGVFHNEVVVRTFAKTEEAGSTDLTETSRIAARDGQAGYLLPSCIHNVSNETERPSCTLHLFGTDDMLRPAECTTTWFGDASAKQMPGNLRARAMGIFADILLHRAGSLPRPLIARVFALASRDTKLQIVQGVARRDPAFGLKLSTLLAQELDGSDRDRLSVINERLSKKVSNLDSESTV